MANGTIRTLRTDKGYGFLSPEGSNGRKDLFFHRSAVDDNGFDMLFEGQEVTFEEAPDPRDPSRRRAIHVRPTEE